MIVEIPETIARLLPAEPGQRVQRVTEGLVIGAYTQGVITRGRACELLGLNYWAGEKFFSDRGVFVNYDLSEFKQDLGN
jgi:predicted HTH domain antitoxin